MARFAPLLCVFAVVLAPAAKAGGSNIGTVGAVPAASHAIGGVGQPTSVPTFAAPTYSSYVNGGGAPSFGGGVGAVPTQGMNVTTQDGLTVQTNIDNSQNIQAGHSISVNETINGQPVGYGYSDADFMAVQNAAIANAQAMVNQRQQANQDLENEVLTVVNAWQSQNQNQGQGPQQSSQQYQGY